MTKSDLTLLAVVLDRSGSMESMAKDMEGGLKTLIQEQASLPGECRLTLAQFDDQYDLLADYIDIKTAPHYQLVPRGNTALLDAIGKTIVSVGERLAAIPESERPAHVIFNIITDGQENASHEWTNEKVKEVITQQTDQYGWVFNYLGANQDGFAVGTSMGIHNSTSYASTPGGATASFLATTASVTRTRTGGSNLYTEEEKEAAAAGDPTKLSSSSSPKTSQ